jgi:hypothetical protein
MTDAGEVPAVVGDGGVDEAAALHPQNRTAEASSTPHPGLRLQTCRNPRVSVRLRCIGPPRMIRPLSRRVDRCELFVGQLAKLACLTLCEFRTRVAAVFVFAGAARGTALDAAQLDANSHCHMEILLQKGRIRRDEWITRK